MVSIIIPSFNENDNIIKTLDNLTENITQGIKDIRYEIIVVDSSNDETFNIIKESSYYNRDNYIFIHSKEKLFPGEARNIGVKRAKYDIIVFVDSGFSFQKRWIENLITPLLENKSIDISWGITETSTECDKDRIFAYLIESKSEKRRILPNMAIRKKVFYDGHWFSNDLRAVEDTRFIKEIIPLYEETFVNAKNYYSGHPSSFVGAFKKWNTYSYYSLKAGYYSKLRLSIIQFLIYIIFFIMFKFSTAIILSIFVQLIRILMKSNKKYKIKLLEIPYILTLSLFVDIGRLSGSIKGLIYNKNVE